MIEQIDKGTPKPRKFVCRNYHAYLEDVLCRYIDEHIGCFPDDYEIISIVSQGNNFYVFFKQYIE